MNLKFFLKYPSCRHFIAAPLFLMSACLALFLLQSQIKLPEFNLAAREGRKYSAPFFKAASMGYWPAAVDWMWIETLQFTGGDSKQVSVPYAVSFYEIATDLDPRFYGLYEQAGVFFSFFMNAPVESVRFLEKGIRNYEALPIVVHPIKGWDHPYTLHLLAAYVYAYQMNDWPKAKEYYLKAAEVPGSPQYLQNMRKWLDEPDAEKNLAVRVLKILIQMEKDPATKSKYEEKLKSYD